MLAEKSVDVGEVAELVVVALDPSATLECASLYLVANMPVPAANPMTAADKNAMIADSIKTRAEHPQIVRLLPGGWWFSGLTE